MKHLFLLVALMTSFTANAASFSFEGNLAKDSDYQLFSFAVDDLSEVEIHTSGYKHGGFDPMIALFYSENGDGTFTDRIVNNDISFNNGKFDSKLELDLEAGDYFIVLGLDGQDLSTISYLSSISQVWAGLDNLTDSNGNPYKPFDGRTSFWEIEFSGDHVYDAALVNPAPVPVPAAVWLFGSALLGLTGIKKRKAA